MKLLGRSLSLLSGLQARFCLISTHLNGLLPLYFLRSSDHFNIGSPHFSLENMISLKVKFQVCSRLSLMPCFYTLHFYIAELPPNFYLSHFYRASQYLILWSINCSGSPDIWKGQKLLRVSKSPINIPDLATKFQTTLKDALRGVVFDFRSAFVDDLTGLPASSPTLGSTRTRFDRRIGVLISFELLLPLLRDDITLAERKTSLFHLAVVLFHETVSINLWYSMHFFSLHL